MLRAIRKRIEFLKAGSFYTFSINVNLDIDMFNSNSTLNFGIPPVLVFQWEVYYKVDRLITGLTAQQKGTNGIQIKPLYERAHR